MYKRLIILVLVISTIQIPVSMSVSDSSNDGYIPSSSPLIESQLKMELTQYKTHTAERVLAAGNTGVSSILRFQSELTKDQVNQAEDLGIQFNRRNGNVIHVGSIYTATVSDIESLNRIRYLGLIQASSGSKQYYPSLATSVPSIGAPTVWNEFELDGEAIDGTGTRVAVIDTGATWLHPSLWRASSEELSVHYNGTHYFVDIDGDSVFDENEGPINTIDQQSGSTIDYSDDYMFIDIEDNGRFDFSAGDRWLGGIDSNHDGFIDLNSEHVVILGESKVAILYDQVTSSVYVRGVNLTDAINVLDTIGHGTHVASIVAGGQIGMTDYVGVAPGADLIIIKSPLDSDAVIDAISFAAENDADVINMSFSSYLGFLDGSDYEDLAINEALMQYGAISTLAAGNLGGRPKHASFTITSSNENSATLSVHSPPSYSFLNILWRSDNDDEHVVLTPPDSEERIDLGEFNEIKDDYFEINHGNISAYVFADKGVKGINRVIIQISSQDHFWDLGLWDIGITNPTGDDVIVHMYAWDNAWGGTALRFTTKIDYTHTISSPGTADLGITVASFNEITMLLSDSSSLGPRVDEVPKPLVTAPGDAIRAAYNSVGTLWYTRSGTSMAAPHAAGVVALIKDASGDIDGWRTLSALLQGSGGAENHFSEPSDSWGFGIVNPVWSIQQLLSGNESLNWNGIPALVSDGSDLDIDGGYDILNVSTYLETDKAWFRIGFRGTPDFSTNDVLTLNWDTDNSMATGKVGVDLKVNVSSNIATIYEWQSGAFVATGETEWSNSSNFVYLYIEHTLGVDLGRIEIQSGDLANSSKDETATSFLVDLWFPLIESFSMSYSDEIYTINLELSDKDTDSSLLAVSIDVVDGDLDVLNEISASGVYTFETEIDTSEISSTDMLSLLIVLSDGTHDLGFPPVVLSSGSSLQLQIIDGSLDRDIVRIGPLITERITGNFTVQGYLLASDVFLSLQSSYGAMFNLSLTGSNGVYRFDISTAGLVAGAYDVFAVAISQSGTEVSLLLGQLSLVDDYSYAILIGGIGVGLAAVVLILWKWRK